MRATTALLSGGKNELNMRCLGSASPRAEMTSETAKRNKRRREVRKKQQKNPAFASKGMRPARPGAKIAK
jgi:hypothetical protein